MGLVTMVRPWTLPRSGAVYVLPQHSAFQLIRQVRLHKAIIAITVVSICALQILRLVNFADHFTTLGTTRLAIEIAACFYLLLLTPFYAFTSTDRAHRQLTHHLFWVSMLLVLHYYFVISGPALAIGYTGTTHWTMPYALGLSTALVIACGTTSLGPGRYRERSRLYNKAISDKLREAGEVVESNVIGVEGSILGKFLSFPTTSMIRRVVSVDQVDLDELPVLPAWMQQQPAILESIQWRGDRKSKWLGPTASLLLEVWGPQWLGWLQRKSTTIAECCRLLMFRHALPAGRDRRVLYSAYLRSADSLYLGQQRGPKQCLGLCCAVVHQSAG